MTWTTMRKSFVADGRQRVQNFNFNRPSTISRWKLYEKIHVHSNHLLVSLFHHLKQIFKICLASSLFFMYFYCKRLEANKWFRNAGDAHIFPCICFYSPSFLNFAAAVFRVQFSSVGARDIKTWRNASLIIGFFKNGWKKNIPATGDFKLKKYKIIQLLQMFLVEDN